MNDSNGHTNSHATNASDYEADLDLLYSWMPPAQPTPQPLPEAAFSVTVKGFMGGHDTMITVRAMSPAELHRNLQAITGLLDAPASASAPPQVAAPGKDWCTKHQATMQRHENAHGVWHSHYVDGRHCKGK